ncbi:DNA invertase Pin-like site-specific DNA recombinase [Bacillus mesophilus]|uniref:Recombinase family protein n=1 Tax=Bacillus mesophilus TaxID=1808955 RepID=A0A6M0Q9R1_9BACI|nr:DNA invertase Pin-like site-specific DNA recombinase [Bacillus mesophilus]NEY73101.1 recombinase family protein [Bacillus mesophilus]
MTTLRPAVGYLRISDNRQKENHSEEIQKRMISEKARQEGYEIILWRFDEAVSGFRKRASKRKKMQLLLNDAKDVEAIFFYDESRITRRIHDFQRDIYLPIKEQYPHVKFFSSESASGEWDPNDPLVQAKLVFANEESSIKSKRAKDAQLSILANNDSDKPSRPGTRTPVGYDLVEGLLIPNEDSPIVTRIFDMASWGYSNEKIKDILNDEKVKTKHISQWHSSTVDYILKNIVYAGHLSWSVKQSKSSLCEMKSEDLEPFKDVHDPIISPVMFSVVTQVKSYKKRYGKLETPFFLRNLLYCGKCNTAFKTKDNSPKGKEGKYQVYRCENCKVNVKVDDIHKEVKSDLSKKWTSNLHQMIEESKSALTGWMKTLKAWKKSVEQTEERILFNKRMISQQEEQEDIETIFKSSKELIKKEKLKINQAIEKIELLNNDMALLEVYSHFKKADISSLLNNELRTLCLTFIDKIKLTYSKDNDFMLSINYRLNPFVEIETSTGQITEELMKQLPEKPKDLKVKK